VSARQTQQRILDAAEKLFARHGFAATSLRNVTGEADVNLAAVHYHFGSKEALIGAVFARRLGPLNDECLHRLADAESQAGPQGPTVEVILRTLIQPTAELARREAGRLSLLAGLLGRVNDETCAQLVHASDIHFAALYRRYLALLSSSLPHLSPAELNARFHFLIGAMASSLGDPRRIELLTGARVDAPDLDTLSDRLVTFLAAGLHAPATADRSVFLNRMPLAENAENPE
jgi:AcrR family transcriptional regulator